MLQPKKKKAVKKKVTKPKGNLYNEKPLKINGSFDEAIETIFKAGNKK